MLTPQSNDFITPKATIRNSPIEGRGLFAISDIGLDETVVIWKGNYTNKLGAEEARKNGKLIMQWDEDLFSFEDRGDDQGYFINHSCDSNVWMKDAHTLVARKVIKAGEEITADYALWEADPAYKSTWICKCTSEDCRKTITGNDWKIEDVQKRYHDHFSPLINKLIAGLLK